MQDVGRIGIPNLIGQGDQIARTRGTITGGELALHETAAQAVRREGVERAEHLAPAHRVEGIDRRERERRGGDGRRGDDGDGQAEDEGEDGERHLVDITV